MTDGRGETTLELTAGDTAGASSGGTPPTVTIAAASSGTSFSLSAADLSRLYGRAPAAVERRLRRLAALQKKGLDSPRERRLFVSWLEAGRGPSPARRRRRSRRRPVRR